MIMGTTANYQRYTGLHPLFSRVFDFIINTDWENMKFGRYPVAGTDAYINFSKNDLLPDNSVFEAHRKYIDIQFIVSGCEEIKCCPLANGKIEEDYSEDKDYCLLKSSEYTTIVLNRNEWCIFFPEDAHAACKKHTADFCLKAVAKVPL